MRARITTVRRLVLELRKLGWTHERIAREVGVSERTISRYVSGATEPVSPWITRALSGLLAQQPESVT